MKAIEVVFYTDLHEIKEQKSEEYYESVVALIDYIRLMVKIHRGQFDLFHMDGYGPNGVDKITINFKSFEDFRDFMVEKYIDKLDNIAVSQKYMSNYKKTEGSE